MATTSLGKVLLHRELAYLSAWQDGRPSDRQRKSALVSARNGDIARAVTAFEKLARRQEAQWWDLQNAGAALLMVGQYERGERWLQRALEAKPGEGRILSALAVARWLQGARSSLSAVAGDHEDRRYQAWVHALEAGVAHDGDSFEALVEAAAAYLQQRRVSLHVDYLALQTGLTGGMKIFFEQANWLAKRGHEVKVLAYGPKPPWMELRTEFEQVSPDQLLADGTAGADLAVTAFWTQNHDLDRVWPATRVFLAQGDEYVWEPERFPTSLQKAVRQSHQVAASLLSVSPALARRIEDLYGRRSGHVPNGLDTSVFHPRPRSVGGPFRIMAVGRDDLAFKGISDVFEAVRLVRETGLDCELTWVSPVEPTTKGMECQFYKSPSQETLARLYAESDVFVSASRYESFSLPCLEAMACGTPVVSASNEGVKTYGRDGENCLLVPSAQPAALAEAILRLAGSRELASRLSDGGLRTAAAYAWERVAEQLEGEFYRLWLGDLFADAPPTPVEQESISLCMIVRNEEQDLGRCLDSVAGAVDEMIVVDTGSTDATVSIAEQRGARVFHFPWRGDFSAARNESLRLARGRWILWLDADEELMLPDPDYLRRALRANHGAAALTLPIESLMDSNDASSRIVHTSPRLFENRPGHRFSGVIHEQIQEAIESRGGRILPAFVTVRHYGYLPEVRKAKRKDERNLELLSRQVAEHPRDAFARFNLATEYFVLNDFKTALREYQHAYADAPKAARGAQYFSKLMRNLSQCHRQTGDLGSALSVVKEAQRLYSDYTDLWLTEGMIYYDLKHWQEALTLFDRCLEMGPAGEQHLSAEGSGTYTPWYYKGLVYENMGDPAAAINCYTESLRMNADYREPALRLAFWLGQPSIDPSLTDLAEEGLRHAAIGQDLAVQAHRNAGRYLRAAEAARGLPEHDWVVMVRGIAALHKHEYEEAERLFGTIPEDSGEWWRATAYRCITYWLMGRADQCSPLHERLKPQHRFEGQTYEALSQMLAGQQVESLPQQADERITGTVESILDLLADLGEFSTFEEVLRIFNHYQEPRWRVRIGKLLISKGFSDAALALLGSHDWSQVEDEEGLRLLGGLCADRDLWAEAESCYRRAMSISQNPRAYFAPLGALLLRAGKVAEAQQLLSRIDQP